MISVFKFLFPYLTLLSGIFCPKRENSISLKASNCYKYYDIYSIKGISLLDQKNKKYPYVQISELGDSIIVDHFLSNEETFKSEYKLYEIHNGLNRKFLARKGKSSLEFHQYLKNKTIYTFMYDLSVSKKLATISLFSNNTLVTYAIDVFKSPINFNISIDSVFYYIDTLNIYSKETISFSESSQNVILSRDFINYKIKRLSNKKKYLFNHCGLKLTEWLIFKWQLYSDSTLFFEEKVSQLK